MVHGRFSKFRVPIILSSNEQAFPILSPFFFYILDLPIRQSAVRSSAAGYPQPLRSFAHLALRPAAGGGGGEDRRLGAVTGAGAGLVVVGF